MALFIWRDTQAARGPLIRCGAANGWGDLLPGRGEPGRAGRLDWNWGEKEYAGDGERACGGWGVGLRGMGRGLAGELCGADRGAGIGNTCGTHWITLCGVNDMNN